MKKLMTLMLGLSLALGCASVTFAEDAPKPKKEKKAKKAQKKKKGEDTKKAA